MPSEADTCRQYVVPKLYAAGWTDDQIAEQRTFTAGRILVAGRVARRGKPRRADYLLFYKPSYPLAVVEAKATYRSPTDGMQQAKDYAQTLGLLFAYATNGTGIVEFDASTGSERTVDAFPTPAVLWARYRAAKGLPEELLTSVFVAKRVVCSGSENCTSPAGLARRTAATRLGAQRSGLETDRDRCRLGSHVRSGEPVADARQGRGC